MLFSSKLISCRYFNASTSDFLKWSLPVLNLDTCIVASRAVNKYQNRMTNKLNPDELVRLEWPHLDLYYFQSCLLCSAGMKYKLQE